MNEELANVDWESLFKDLSVEEIWNRFKTSIMCLLTDMFPLK